MHLFSCKEAMTYTILSWEQICVRCSYRNSYMVYLCMILSVLWIMDGRGVTTRPEEKDMKTERCIPSAF